jgi:hypothetical protein
VGSTPTPSINHIICFNTLSHTHALLSNSRTPHRGSKASPSARTPASLQGEKMDPPFCLVETAFTTYLVMTIKTNQGRCFFCTRGARMAAAVVDVEVEAAASMAAVDASPLLHVVLRRPQAATAPRRRRTPPDLSPASHPRRHNVFRRRHLQRSHLDASSSSAYAALQHKQKVLGSSPT